MSIGKARKLGTSGSVVVVILVAVVLGILGGAAIMMSSGYHRRDTQDAIRYSAKMLCQSIAEEAALMVHNGTADVLIDEAVGCPKKLKIEDTTFKNAVKMAGVDIDGKDKMMVKPEVTVMASIANHDGLTRSTLDQWNEITTEIKNMPNDNAKALAEKFWTRMRYGDGKDDKGKHVGDVAYDANTQDALKEHTSHSFANMTNNWCVCAWGHSTSCRPAETESIHYTKGTMDGMEELYKACGGTITSQPGCGVSTHTSMKWQKASMAGGGAISGDFPSVWEKVLAAVAKDAASKVQSCGSNPAGALAHLIGDMDEGDEVASGAEVAATESFLKSAEYGETKTYLLKITAKVAYGTAGRFNGDVEYTAFRLFQKCPWENAVIDLGRAIVRCLRNHKSKHATMGDSTIQSMWGFVPKDQSDPEAKVYNEKHKEKIPGSSNYYDPYRVFMEPVSKQLPSTVGSRLYPYAMAQTTERPPQ